MQKISYEANDCSKFIIIRLNLSNTTTCYRRYKMLISHFNPDKVQIPGIKETFILKSAIIHKDLDDEYDTFSKVEPICGHFTTLIRDSKGKNWFEISDSTCQTIKFNKYLENAFVLMLEKN